MHLAVHAMAYFVTQIEGEVRLWYSRWNTCDSPKFLISSF